MIILCSRLLLKTNLLPKKWDSHSFFCLWWSSFENVDVLYFEEGKCINDVVLSYPVGLLSRHAKKISREKACQDEVIHCQDVIC